MGEVGSKRVPATLAQNLVKTLNTSISSQLLDSVADIFSEKCPVDPL
jgi:hypothetical protein